ncbi:MAG: hypothetical protein AVDCRST_MAG87-391 [uncultured Thermomicrobiales bacterium]|uniref:DUF1579 domain-containing protein n=1 Tax=uncultured Thermomicrobiales bacterium TaxID=1645740 RepID=A0A6J4U9T2_9BACT|nr:MAG: hypothetical protein AVDCRST_MAG87-391 [uncultured Thermomicrobiales bacterium]
MPDCRHLLKAATIGGVFLGSVLTHQAVAQTATPAAMSASDRMNELGPENGMIALRAGLWDVTETRWPAPGAAPVTTTGLVAERVIMGSLLQEFLRPPSDTAHNDVKRTDLLSFNRVEGRWKYVSFDTRAPVGLMPALSAVPGDGSSIEIVFEPFAITGPGTQVTGQMLRMEQTIRYEGPDRDVKEQYFTLADGTGRKWLAHQYAYVRRP